MENEYKKKSIEYFKTNNNLQKIFQGRFHEWNENIVRFLTTFAQVIGIVAGLGVTGISLVRHIESFVIGEMLLFFTIIMSIYYSKFVAVDPLKDIELILNNIYDVQNRIKKALISNDNSELKKISEDFDKKVYSLEGYQKLSMGDTISPRITVLLLVALVGGVLIFSSFVNGFIFF